MKKQIWVYSYQQQSKPEGAGKTQAKGYQRDVLGLGLGGRGARLRPQGTQPGTVPPRAGCCLLCVPWPHPGHAHWDMPGPGFPGARGSSRRGLQKSKCLSKGTKTFCLTKASTGEEQPSPFLFKSLYFPAGWPGHSLFFLL